MSTDQPSPAEDPITEVPKSGLKKRYVVIALLVVLAVVFGLRRARTKPVASDAASPQTES
jgi:hypothetical protein